VTSYRADIAESKKEKNLTLGANLNCHNEDIITSCFEWLTILRKNNQVFISETGLFVILRVHGVVKNIFRILIINSQLNFLHWLANLLH
jgi:hypothetical protein